MAAGVQLGLDLLLWTGVDFRHQVCETKEFQGRNDAAASCVDTSLLEHLQTHPSARTSTHT